MSDQQVAYVVTSGSYSSYQIERVYLDKEAAYRFCDNKNRLLGFDGEYVVEEHQIGAGQAEYDGVGWRAWWRYDMRDDPREPGFDPRDPRCWKESEKIDEIWHTGDPANARVTVRSTERNYTRIVQVIGTSREHVEKVLHDTAAEMKAEALGLT